MRWIALLAALGLALGGCGDGDRDDLSPPPPAQSGSAGAMAASLLHLVTKDNTFGDGPPPFGEYLVQSRLERVGAGPPGARAGEGRALDAAERAAIEEALSPLGPVRFIEDPDEWRSRDLQPTIAGSAILGVGEPRIAADTALVPVSLWCGGLCGTWLTYRLGLSDGAWRVLGTKGPIAIS